MPVFTWKWFHMVRNHRIVITPDRRNKIADDSYRIKVQPDQFKDLARCCQCGFGLQEVMSFCDLLVYE